MQKYCEAAIGGPGYVDEIISCDGVEICIFDKEVYSPTYTQLHLIDALVKLYGDKFKLETGELARARMCCDEVCDMAKNGESLLPIIPKQDLILYSAVSLRCCKVYLQHHCPLG